MPAEENKSKKPTNKTTQFSGIRESKYFHWVPISECSTFDPEIP